MNAKKVSKGDIGKSLQACRKHAGYKSAREFAEHIGLSVSKYTTYEQGRYSMNIETACLIADTLHVSLDELLGRKPPIKQVQAPPDERQLIGYYRAMTNDGKAALLGSAAGMAPLFPETQTNAGVA